MRILIALLVAVLLALGCQTVPVQDGSRVTTSVDDAGVSQPGTTEPGAGEVPSGPLSPVQEVLVRAAREVIASQSTIVAGTTYSYDCSGTILTIFAHAGIYLIDLFQNYTGNGVARLYGIAVDYDLLHVSDLPEPGDLIFWDNTYDRNGDGEWNDPLTHAGMVLAVDDDGTVEYVHHNYRRGIVTASMNLLEPDVYETDEGAQINSPMRMASQRSGNPDLWLSSHLFREFASMHSIEIDVVNTGGREAVASAR